MRQLYTFLSIALLSLLPAVLNSQSLSTPEPEAVFGGRVNAMDGYRKTTDTTRLFVATESANSVFFADMYTPLGSSPLSTFGKFRVMKGLSDKTDYGSGIRNISAHATSGYLVFAHENNLLASHPSSAVVKTIDSGSQFWGIIKNDSLFYTGHGTSGKELHFGTLDASANFSESASSPITIYNYGGTPHRLEFNETNNKLYLFVEGTGGSSPMVFRSSDNYGIFTGSTTLTDISPSFTSGRDYKGFGIAPDGAIFIGSSDGLSKYISRSNDEVTWNEYSASVGGVASTRFDFSGMAANYRVYFANMYSNAKGDAGSWTNFGNVGMMTHPNDGDVFTDPGDTNIVYMTTDQGIGASKTRGSVIFEIDKGLRAVQVNDFDMSADKTTGYVASKSGIRKVSKYTTSNIWSRTEFPNGDGSPYYSAEMIGNDTNKVYVGNVRVYKSVDNLGTFKKVFTPENAPYNYSNIGTRIECIEVCEYDTSIVFAGAYLQDSNKGGLFYSHDGGTNWDQILLHSSSSVNDVDVWDVIFTLEGSDTIAYVGVEYDLSAPTGRSVYKLTKNGSSWTAVQDMSASTTSTGSLIVASIRDLHKSTTGDTIFACGTDAGVNHPIAYYKPVSATGKWTPFTTSGFPFGTGMQGYAITYGIDTVYCAVENEIYTYKFGDSKWYLGYDYAVGTNINVLYYDDLLVGTGTGLYGHHVIKSVVSNTKEISTEKSQISTNWNRKNNTLRLKSEIEITRGILRIVDLQGRMVYSNPHFELQKNTSTSISISYEGSMLIVDITSDKLTLSKKVIGQ